MPASHRMKPHRLAALLLVALTAAAAPTHAAPADPTPYCGDEGVWLQILGAGGPELTDGQASASYAVFIDNKVRLLVNPAPGATASLDRAGGRVEDLEAVLFTNLLADHSSDLPALLHGAFGAGRDRALPVIGPEGNDTYPATSTFVDRLVGREGAFPYLAELLTTASRAGFQVNVRDVPATGQRDWSQFRSDILSLRSIPVHHGAVPAVAWRMDVNGRSIVFAGSFNNQKNLMPAFARDADALVVHHAIPDNARGEARDRHVTPGQIGRIADQAGVRMVILGHRTQRTRGLESLSRAAIEENFTGPLIFANDLECWGL